MTKQLYRIKFHFTAPVHIGSVRADYDSSQKRMHSDTLYAAIMQAWSVLGKKCWIEKDPNCANFTLSSLFPFQQMTEKKSDALYFFPKPVNALQPTEYRTHKKLKKIQYLEQGVFKKYLQIGEKAFMDWLKTKTNDFDNKESTEQHLKKAYCFSSSDTFNDQFMQSKVYPRVYVPRQGERNNNNKVVTDTEIYYIERLFFNGHSGLFCLATFDDETTRKKVLGALEYLGDEGIGTDRNVGNGSFVVDCEAFNDFDDLTMTSDYRLNLSLFCPESQDKLAAMLPDGDDNIAYHLQKRGGWITKSPYLTYRKQAVYMFGEGSVFKTNVATAGKTVNLRPKGTPKTIAHPIYRVGKSLFLPIHV